PLSRGPCRIRRAPGAVPRALAARGRARRRRALADAALVAERLEALERRDERAPVLHVPGAAEARVYRVELPTRQRGGSFFHFGCLPPHGAGRGDSNLGAGRRPSAPARLAPRTGSRSGPGSALAAAPAGRLH